MAIIITRVAGRKLYFVRSANKGHHLGAALQFFSAASELLISVINGSDFILTMNNLDHASAKMNSQPFIVVIKGSDVALQPCSTTFLHHKNPGLVE